MPLMSKRVALYSRSTPYFTALSRVESWPALKQYLFAVTIAKSGANACTKCPAVTILGHSFPTSSYSSRTWLRTALAIFRNGSYRRFRHRVYCRRVRSFLAVLFRCSFRRNSSRCTRSARSNMIAYSFLPAIEKLDFAVQINRDDSRTTLMAIARVKLRLYQRIPEWYFLRKKEEIVKRMYNCKSKAQRPSVQRVEHELTPLPRGIR